MDLEAPADTARRAAANMAKLAGHAEAATDLALELASGQSRRRFHYPGRVIDPTPFPLLAGDIPGDHEANT